MLQAEEEREGEGGIQRKGYVPGRGGLRMKSNWRDVHSNLLAMDQFYDASFYAWIKDEGNVHISSGHLRRILVEFPEERVVNALKWLISDWTLGAITVLLKKLFTDYFWEQSCSSSDLSSAILISSNGNSSANCLLNDSSELQLNYKGRKRKSVLFGECGEDEEWNESELDETEFLILAGVRYTKTNEQFGREVEIIKNIINDWSPNFIGELLCSLMNGWSLPQKEFFLFRMARKWSFQKLSDVFLYLGNSLDWQFKLTLLKKFGAAQFKNNLMGLESGKKTCSILGTSSSAARRIHHRRKRSNLSSLDERSAELIHTAISIAHEDTIA